MLRPLGVPDFARLWLGTFVSMVGDGFYSVAVAGGPLSFAVVGPLAGAIGADATLIWAGVVGVLANIFCMLIPGARAPERNGSLVGAYGSDGQSPSALGHGLGMDPH